MNKSLSSRYYYIVSTVVLSILFLSCPQWASADERLMTTTQTYYTSPFPSPASFVFKTGNDTYAEANGTLHVAYVENYELYYLKSIDGGVNWIKTHILTGHDGDIRSAVLTVDHNGIVFIGITVNNNLNYADPSGTAYGTEWNFDLYCVNNKTGSWAVDPRVFQASDNTGMLATGILVDGSNNIHLFTSRYGWYTYGGTAYEWERDAVLDTWNGPNTAATVTGDVDHFFYEYFRPLIDSAGNITLIMSRYNGASNGADDYLFYVQKDTAVGGAWSSITPIDQPNRSYASAYNFDAAIDSSNHIYLIYVKDVTAGTPQILFSTDFGTPSAIYTGSSGEQIYDIKLHSDSSGNLTMLARRGIGGAPYPTAIAQRPAGGAWSSFQDITTAAPDNDVFYLGLAQTDTLTGVFSTPKATYFDREVTGQVSPGPFGPDKFYFSDFGSKWKTTTPLPVNRLLSVAASPGNGYVYIANGYVDSNAQNNGTADGRSFYALQNSNGTLGAWQEATAAIPANFRRAAAGVASHNGYIYVAGGAINSPSWDGSIWYTKPESTGNITSWTQSTNSISNWIGSWPYVGAYNGYLYVGGGFRAFGQYSDRFYYAPINADGSIGVWTQTTNLPAASTQGQLLFHNNRAYVILGNSSSVYFADITNGSIGAWTDTASLPSNVDRPSSHVVNNRIYVVQGGTSAFYYSDIQQDGTLSQWTLSDPLQAGVWPWEQGTYYNGYYYLLGDQSDTSNLTRALYYSLPKANLISNGSFESGNFQSEPDGQGGYNNSWDTVTHGETDLTDWSVTSIDEPIDWHNSTQFNSPPDGTYLVDLNLAAISQSFATTNGAWYKLSFYMASPQFNQTEIDRQILVNVAGVSQTFSAPLSDYHNPVWVACSMDFQATSNLTTISFTGLNTNGSWGALLDDVRVEGTSAPANVSYSLTTGVSGNGSVELNPTGGTYDAGATVTLTAIADTGWQFSNWSGSLTGSTNPATVTMNSNKSVTATFTQIAPNNPPDPPSAVGPADEEAVTTETVTLTASPFHDPDSSDTQTESIWMVRRADSVYGREDYDSSFEAVTVSGDFSNHIVTGLSAGMKYVWKVGYVDSGSQTITWSEEHSFKVGQSSSDTMPTVYAGTDIADFKMVSFPYWLDNPSAQSVFNISYDTRYYRIGHFRPDKNNGEYEEINTPGVEINPGEALWMLCRNPMNLNVTGIPVSTQYDIEVPLYYNTVNGNGWNQIGCPNEKNYAWGNIQVIEYDQDGNVIFGPTAISDLDDPNAYVDVRIWEWNNGAYQSHQPSDQFIMKAYEGYWIKAKMQNLHLIFRVSVQVAANAAANKSTMFALYDKGRQWVKDWIIAEPLAVADTGDSPPMPPGVFTTSNSEASSGTGGCFIATAAYGSPLERHVKILRVFRDRILLSSSPGRLFVKLYYKYSPSAAGYIAQHENLRTMVRIGLLPLVGAGYLAVHHPLILAAFIIFGLIAVSGISYFLIKTYGRQSQKMSVGVRR